MIIIKHVCFKKCSSACEVGEVKSKFNFFRKYVSHFLAFLMSTKKTQWHYNDTNSTSVKDRGKHLEGCELVMVKL